MNRSTKSSCRIPKPLRIAIDTNILIGLINEEDRLHESSIKLVTSVDILLVSTSVVMETVNTFTKKVLDVFTDVNQYILSSKQVNHSELVEYLNKKRPRYVNFNKYVAKKVTELWEKHRDVFTVFIEITRELRELADFEKIMDFIEQKLDVNATLELYGVDRGNSTDLEMFEEILNELEECNITFKDNFDREIFIETVAYSRKTNTRQFIFVTDDKEFFNKANRGLNCLNIRSISFCMLGNALNKLTRMKS